MNGRFRFAGIGLALLAFLFFSGQPVAGETGDGQLLTVRVFDVGHGDMILVTTPGGRHALIDCGDAGSQKARLALGRLPERLDWFFATHAHDDHIGNSGSILPRVRTVVDSGHAAATVAQETLYAAAGQVAGFIIARAGDRFDLGNGVVCETLAPGERLLFGTGADANNNSLLLMLRYRNFRMLLAADIEIDGLDELLARAADIACSVVKVPHHGSRGSAHDAFIRRLGARQAIVSAAADGDPRGHGLPHNDLLARYRAAGMEVFVTGRQGTITVTSDGSSHAVRGDP